MGVLKREVRSGVALVRGSGEEVASRVVPGGRVASVEDFISVRGLRFFKFISSIRFRPVSRVRHRAASYSYITRSSRTGSSIRYR